MGRIDVVHLVLTMDAGGLERVAIDLVRALDPERFGARIICLRGRGALAQIAAELGVAVESLGARNVYDGVMRLSRKLRRIKPAILHTHNPGPHLVGVPARLLARIPVLVHTKHGRNLPGDSRAVAMNRWLSRLTGMVVCVSRDAADVALDIERVSPSKVCVIRNGIEPGEPLPAAAWDSWRPTAITVARLDAVKDQPTMLRALRLAIDSCPDLRLEIVGDGPERPLLERLTRELGLSRNVQFLGFRRDVHELLRRPQIFLLSSLSEGVSLTLLEAMAAGLPIVATDVGGNREVVVDQATGFLVPAGRPEAIANRMLTLVRDPAMARAFGTAGRRRVEESFDLRLTVRRYQDLYASLLEQKAPRP